MGGMDGVLCEWVKRAAEERSMGEAFRILEIGCGEGDRFDELSRYGQVSGVELDEEAAEKARSRHPAATVQRADFCKLPFDEEYELVFSEDAFSLMADQVGLLKSIAQSLVLEGVLVARMGGAGSLARVQEGFAEALSKHSGGYSCQFCFPKESAYRCVLDIAGLSVLDMQLVDCPVVLPGEEKGLRLLAEKCFGGALGVYRPQDRESLLCDFEDACRDDLWDEERRAWVADVRFLRFAAKKTCRALRLGGASQLSALGF